MKQHRIFGIVAAGLGTVCAVIGIAALKWYFWDIVIGEAGQADRSMLFWGLPLAGMGVTAVTAAVLLGWYARKQLGSRRRESANDGQRSAG